MMKHKKILSFALAFGFIFGGAACKKEETPYVRAFDNVIVVIGDGMGENHILNAITYFDLDVPVFMEDQVGYIKTDSLSGLTDSAAGGTALATGNKVYNSNLAQLNGKDLERITDIAKKAGMKTGVVTTDTLNGATPSAFSAHAADRNDTASIVETQAKSNVNLLFGQYESHYHKNYRFEDAGYSFVYPRWDYETQLTPFIGKNKLIATVSTASAYIEDYNAKYIQLKDMAKFAVEFLENDKGFFLMIEGAYIDKYSHNNQLHEAMSETRSLFDTIAFLYEYASDGKTAIFITADHETGGLQRATDKESMSNALYTTGNHTRADVPLFVKNYEFDSTKFGYESGVTPENTVVFDACKKIIQG